MILGLVLLIYSTCMFLIPYPGIQFMTFFLGLIGGGYFLSAAVLGQYNTYARGASYLTLPVSNFEKWLCGVVIVLVIYLPLFLFFYRIMDSTLVEVYRNNLDPKAHDYAWSLKHAKILDYDSITVIILLKIFFNVSGIMLLGALFFNKLAHIKVAMFTSALLFIGIGLNYMIARSLFENNFTTFPFLVLSIKKGEIFKEVELPLQAQFIVSTFFMYVLPVILYLLAYLKLKEKEF